MARRFVALIFFAAVAAGATTFPVKYSADKHYLVDQSNAPFPILGRTSWAIASLTAADARTYLDDTAARGYNAIEVFVPARHFYANHVPFNGTNDAPFLKRLDGAAWDGSLLPFGSPSFNTASPDFTTPNEAYWASVDAVLSYCDSKGILVLLFPSYVGFKDSDPPQGWMGEMVANGPAKMQSYGAWIAARYKNQKNIVWMMGGDQGTGSYTFDQAQTDVETALLNGIKSVAGQQSTLFSAEWKKDSIGTDLFTASMSLNSNYSSADQINAQGRRACAYTPAEPAFQLEEPYDEEGPDGNNFNSEATQPVRRFQWWGWLSDIGGYMSGNGYVWPFNTSPASANWRNHLNTQNTQDMARLNAFIQSIAWYKLVPSGLNGMKTLVTAGGGSLTGPDYVSAAASPDGKLLAAYVPPAHAGAVTVDMTAMSGSVRARWFDPTNAAYAAISGSPFPNTGTHAFSTPGANSRGENDWVLVLDSAAVSSAAGPLRVLASNPRYFTDGSGKAVYLTGSHTWGNLKDRALADPPPAFDYAAYLDFLAAHNHNFFRLWAWEQTHSQVGGGETGLRYITPAPWLRTGPGNASDGKPKFDLNQFDQAYFDRLRARVVAAGSRGMYVAVMLFDGYDLVNVYNPADGGYPCGTGNNVNGVASTGTDGVTLSNTAVTAVQDAYVRKVIDTVNDLDNVLYEIANEPDSTGVQWEYHMITLVKQYEAGKAKQHPVGMTSTYPGSDSDLYNSGADWISPNAQFPAADGRKVVITDTDHSYYWADMKADGTAAQQAWAWKTLTLGASPLFMDPYLEVRANRNSPPNAATVDPYWETLRKSLGNTKTYADKMDLAHDVPSGGLSSTGYCLAKAGAEYLVYQPGTGAFTVNLAAGSYVYEWFNPTLGTVAGTGTVSAPGGSQAFTPPFSGDAVLTLKSTAAPPPDILPPARPRGLRKR